MGNSLQSEAAAFDSMAEQYDAEFTASALGCVLREAVWLRLGQVFTTPGRILELGCGTGEDALWLARAGHRVVALDASAEMIRVARRKAEVAGLAERIEFHVLPMQELDSLSGEIRFDGVFSNFGAVNCAPDLSRLAASLDRRLVPRAPLLFVVMGRDVPWEWAWYLARGQAGKAFRRWRRDGVEWRNLRVRYPTPGQLRHALAPHFGASRARALGCILPPSYAAAWLDRSPRALRALVRLERAAQRVPLSAWLADHYIFEARRA